MDKYLCYIEDNLAYFTNNLKEQWGDDWDDKPYEHNAGPPYENDKFKLTKLVFQSELETPAERFGINSPYSVQDINDKNTPWLSGKTYNPIESIEIYAGTAVEEFIDVILNSGGEIYLKLEK